MVFHLYLNCISNNKLLHIVSLKLNSEMAYPATTADDEVRQPTKQLIIGSIGMDTLIFHSSQKQPRSIPSVVEFTLIAVELVETTATLRVKLLAVWEEPLNHQGGSLRNGAGREMKSKRAAPGEGAIIRPLRPITNYVQLFRFVAALWCVTTSSSCRTTGASTG